VRFDPAQPTGGGNTFHGLIVKYQGLIPVITVEVIQFIDLKQWESR
jgi:hypothetical protein